MKRQRFTVISAAVGILVLILDSRTALSGAKDGIELCIRTLIPSLFPFFVISGLLTGNLMGTALPFLRPIGRLCGIPEGGESLLAVGLLGGYPVGAQNIANACNQGALSPADAERMLAYCNNAGPSFIFGILGTMFSSPGTVWLLWGIHILSALIVGAVTAEKCGRITVCSGAVTLQAAMEKAVRIMALVCGWVILFRIILSFLDSWFLWAIPETLQIVIAGLLELSNGCVRFADVGCEGLRFLMAGCMLSLGGLCVFMQTAAAAKGLSLKGYAAGKLLQCCISFLLCVVCQYSFPQAQRWIPAPALLAAMSLLTAISGIFLRRVKKSSSIPVPLGV